MEAWRLRAGKRARIASWSMTGTSPDREEETGGCARRRRDLRTCSPSKKAREIPLISAVGEKKKSDRELSPSASPAPGGIIRRVALFFLAHFDKIPEICVSNNSSSVLLKSTILRTIFLIEINNLLPIFFCFFFFV